MVPTNLQMDIVRAVMVSIANGARWDRIVVLSGDSAMWRACCHFCRLTFTERLIGGCGGAADFIGSRRYEAAEPCCPKPRDQCGEEHMQINPRTAAQNAHILPAVGIVIDRLRPFLEIPRCIWALSCPIRAHATEVESRLSRCTSARSATFLTSSSRLFRP